LGTVAAVLDFGVRFPSSRSESLLAAYLHAQDDPETVLAVRSLEERGRPPSQSLAEGRRVLEALRKLAVAARSRPLRGLIRERIESIVQFGSEHAWWSPGDTTLLSSLNDDLGDERSDLLVLRIHELDRQGPLTWQMYALAGAVVSLLTSMLVLYGVFPLTLYRTYSWWTTQSAKLPPVVSKLLDVVTAVTIVMPFMATRERVLDAWTRSVASGFAIGPKESYVPLPIVFGGAELRLTQMELARRLFEVRAGGRAPVLAITGSGGLGKTTLLKQLLKWTADGILLHPAVCLLVTRGDDAILTEADVIVGVQRNIAKMLASTRVEPPEFVRALLRTGRLCLAVDRVSELEQAPRLRALRLCDTTPIRHLLMTTRSLAEFDDAVTVEIRPQLLGAADVSIFIAELLPRANFNDTERVGVVTKEAAEFLRRQFRNEKELVPAIVVRLFVEALQRRDFRGESMPQSVTALFFDYAKHYAGAAGSEHMAQVLSALHVLASEAVVRDGTLRLPLETQARSFFDKAGVASAFDELIAAGVLVRDFGGGGATSCVRFSLDPVAEHLAMEHLVLEQRAAMAPGLPPQWDELGLSPHLHAILERVLAATSKVHGLSPDLPSVATQGVP
jgi:hypothetical protein